MPKKLDYQLTDDGQKALERAISENKGVRVVKRATTIRLLHLEPSSKESV